MEYNTGAGDWSAVGFKCPDDYTVEFTLTKANGAFLNNVAINAFYPITQAFAEQWGDSLGSSPESVLCSGPYVLTEWTVDTSMSLVKNDKWWNSANEFPTKNVNILQIDSANTKVSMFENGEGDIISSLDANYISTLSDYVDSYVGSTEMLLWMNEAGNNEDTAKLMGNENFRKALTYALDRNAICGAVSPGFVGTNRAVSSNYPGISDTYVNEYPIDACPVTGDAAKAKEFLQAALTELGYSDVSELPEITYVTFERDDMKLLGETLVDSWKQVLGIDSISFVQYPIGTAIQQFYTGEYDIFMISVGCSISPTDIINGFKADGDYGFFVTNWKTDITDLLAAANASEFQSDEYFKKVAELETAFLNEYSIVPLYNQTFYYALADGVDGYVVPGVSFNYQINHLTVSK
jgi:oligopeptide transport system substrate-binding protein